MNADRLRFFSGSGSAVIGGLLWVGGSLWTVADLRSVTWSAALLTFAALVLVPLLIDLVRDADESEGAVRLLGVIRAVQFPAAGLLVIACLRSPGWVSAVCAAPWILLTGLVALLGGWRLLHRGITPRWALCRDAGLLFFAVGGAWTLADRLGLHPLGFGSDIVQLTAVHFHFAGLVLPVVTGLVLREIPTSRVMTGAAWGVLAGVPLVAVGITSSQLGHGLAMEFFAALVLAVSAMVIAVGQLGLAAQSRWPMRARVCWTVAGISLLFGMSLALLYAARPYVMPLPWLDIPWMRALHGTANALGFALCGVLGWRVALLHPRNLGPG